MREAELAGRAVGVWGVGREGRAAVAVLGPQASSLVIVDEPAKVPAEVPAQVPAQVPEVLGHPVSSDLNALLQADVVVVSPGVPGVHPFRKRLATAGVSVTTPSDLWMSEHAGRAIGVTGTKGKSTAATLAAALVSATGRRSRLLGNIGVPAFGTPMPPEAIAVIELSSYQCASLTASPRVALITSLYAEHLPWHGGLGEYWRAKLNIAQHGCEVLVCPEDVVRALASVNAEVEGLPLCTFGPGDIDLRNGRLRMPRIFDGDIDFPTVAEPLRARHNLSNLLGAALAVQAFGIELSADAVAAALAGFEPLPHRLQTVAEHGGVRFVDDLLSTAPESVAAGLETFREQPVSLIVGGQDRGLSYDALADFVARHDVGELRVVAMPDTGPVIAAQMARTNPGLVWTAASDMDEAIRQAVALLPPAGGVVLLSPAAPSYNAYASFEEKAQDFLRAIEAWASPTPS